MNIATTIAAELKRLTAERITIDDRIAALQLAVDVFSGTKATKIPAADPVVAKRELRRQPNRKHRKDTDAIAIPVPA